MKANSIKPAQMSELARQADMNMPPAFITEKMKSLENEKPVNKDKNKMKSLKKAVKQFLKSKDIELKEFEEFAAAKGLDIPQMKPKDNEKGKQKEQ